VNDFKKVCGFFLSEDCSVKFARKTFRIQEVALQISGSHLDLL